MDIATIVDIIEKISKVFAIFVGGAWIYFKTIRGRAFIPRIQLKIDATLETDEKHQFLSIKTQAKNVGSSIAIIKEKGSAIKIESMKSFKMIDTVMDLTVENETAFSVFKIPQGKSIAIEPECTIFYEELIEVPKNRHNAYRIEFRVSAIHGGVLNRRNRKWRTFAIVLNPNQETL